MVGAALAKVQQQSASIALFNFPTYPFSIEKNVLMEMFSVFITHCTTFLWEKNPKVSEGSVLLVTCMSLISGSSAKGCLQTPHSFEPFCFPKILLLQI